MGVKTNPKTNSQNYPKFFIKMQFLSLFPNIIKIANFWGK